MAFDETGLFCDSDNDDLAFALRLRTSAWLGTVLRASALVLAAVVIAAAASRSASLWWIYGSFAVVLGAAIVLDGTKRSREAGVTLTLGFWATATAAVFFLGGVRSPGAFVYLPIIITAGLFWSWRAAAALAGASFATVIVAAWLDAIHRLPAPMGSGGHLLPVFAGSLTMTAVLVGIALTTLRSAVQDVRRYRIRTEELLASAPGVLAVLDRLGVVLAAGPSLQERTGYEPTDLVGKHVSRVELFGREGRAAVDDLRLLTARVSDADEEREVALRRKDGGRAWGEARLHALPAGKGGSPRRIVLYDVTRRHVAEERRAELEKTVERSRRLETVALLAGGAAHDLNNQLTVVLSLGSVLDAQLPADSAERHILTEINQAAVRAAELVQDLLAAKPAKPAEIIDMGRELAALEPMLSRMAGQRIELSVRVHGGPCFVRIDPVELERIASNLVINARDAMPEGGEILVEIAPASGEGQNRTIELRVTDSGIGMDSLTRQRILEPFYTTKGKAGTGLGLPTVDCIVGRLGGHIAVESEPGRGTKIRIFLPEAETSDVTS